MSAGLAKLQLLIELNNKIGSGLNVAKKQVEKATGQMQGKLDSFKMSNVKAFDAIKEQVPGASQAIGMLANPYVLATAAVISLGVGLYKAIDGASQFEHIFMNIRQLNLDKSRSELDKYRGDINKTAMLTGVNNDQMAQGYYDLQSALGVYGNDTSKIAKLVGNYSIATQADFTDSINSTTKAMKAFGIGVDGVQSLLESNAKTVQTGIVNFADLAKVQTEYAGAASAAGQNVDTANKMFAAFTSIAKNADVAANLTKTAMQGLSDPNVIKGLEKYGVKVYDNHGKMRDFGNIIKQTSGVIGKMDDKKFNSFKGDLGGPEGLTALMGKLRTGAADYQKTMDTFDNTKFNLDDALKNAKNDPATLKMIVGNQMNTIMDTIGLKFLPLVATVLQPISEFLVNIYGYLDGSTKISAEWSPYLNMVKNIVVTISDVFSYLWAILVRVGGAIFDFFKNSVLLQDLAWGIGEAFKLIGDLVKGLADQVLVLWDSIIMPILSGIESAYKWVKELITGKKIEVTAIKKVINTGVPKSTTDVPIRNKPTADDSPTQSGISPSVSSDAKSIGSGSQTKNITINIDSFVKGFTPSHQSVNGMNTAELERWMTEMFLRVVRSAEMAT